MAGIDEFSPPIGGQQVRVIIGFASATQLTSGIAASLSKSLDLTPGVWDVEQTVAFRGDGVAVVTAMAACLGDYGNPPTMFLTGALHGGGVCAAFVPRPDLESRLVCPVNRVVVPAGNVATRYSNVYCEFAGGIIKAYGIITANRIA